MEKAQDALKTIGEMSKTLAVQPHILRYWEEQFDILNPLKRAGGRRYYRSDDARLLHEIYRLIYVEGFTIKGAQKYLREAKFNPKILRNNVPSIPQSAMDNKSMDMSGDVKRKLEHIANGLREAIAA